MIARVSGVWTGAGPTPNQNPAFIVSEGDYALVHLDLDYWWPKLGTAALTLNSPFREAQSVDVVLRDQIRTHSRQ
jgi:hypothetical protein